MAHYRLFDVTNLSNFLLTPILMCILYCKLKPCFSKSLIIHQVKTKEIPTVTVVWIPGLNISRFDDFTSPFTPWFLFRLRRYIKHSRQCFIGYPNTSNFIKNTPLRVVFSTLFPVFGYRDETLSLVFDILLRKQE